MYKTPCHRRALVLVILLIAVRSKGMECFEKFRHDGW
ncbi:hypothetical protein WG66_008200, partial [Moniliophthora roreri]